MKLNGHGGLNPGSFSQQMSELVRLAREKESGFDDKKWKIRIGNQTIIPRDYVADSVRLLSMIGDAAITFAPPQASAPWSALKAVMQVSGIYFTIQSLHMIVPTMEVADMLR